MKKLLIAAGLLVAATSASLAQGYGVYAQVPYYGAYRYAPGYGLYDYASGYATYGYYNYVPDYWRYGDSSQPNPRSSIRAVR